ncbi:MAG: ABC transporter substrate-binding protein/permease [Isosphaeraceae bacterium]
MEENSGASESDASPTDPSDPDHVLSREPVGARPVAVGPSGSSSFPADRTRTEAASRRLGRSRLFRLGLILTGLVALAPEPFALAEGAGLDHVRSSGKLRYGSDMEGGGPYAYPDPKSPREVTGFEVELMAMLANDLGAAPEFCQGQWEMLLQLLDLGQSDIVVNGYEWTEPRARDYLATRPYYVYQLQLMVPRGSPIHTWDDLKRLRPGGGRWTVGVLAGSAADTFTALEGGKNVRAIQFSGSTDAMTAVQNGQYDATLQDVPAARFYLDRFTGLELAGPPQSHGYYVIYTRANDRALREALDQGLARLIARGDLRRLYEKYGIWSEAQRELENFTGPLEVISGRPAEGGWALVGRYWSLLVEAACVTIALSLGSMPLAMLLGLVIAIGRIYGPIPVRAVLSGYVELIRGTPLMLQLFVLFYLLKLPPWVAGIGGLAINYSAYEAEIYRAGLQAIPQGQMEAALALGMSRWMALRRVIVPQAVRIVIPPVTNDFIALFKDTSVCSVITLIELTKEYSILANGTGGAIEFALAASFLYMMMSIPLSWFSRWSERRLGTLGVKGGAAA